MGQLEQSNPEEEIKVEILYPKEYTSQSLLTMKQWSAMVMHICQYAKLRNQDQINFVLVGLTVLQVYALKQSMLYYGISLIHQIKRVNNLNFVWFNANLTNLKIK